MLLLHAFLRDAPPSIEYHGARLNAYLLVYSMAGDSQPKGKKGFSVNSWTLNEAEEPLSHI